MSQQEDRFAEINAIQDDRIRRVKIAGGEAFTSLTICGLKIHNVSFNSSIDNEIFGTIYLRQKRDIDQISEKHTKLAENVVLNVFRTNFPEKHIISVNLEWDSFERIEKEFGGSYDKYWMSL